ncbi:MAG: hypothetical protein E6K91_06730 [Thaumarchaeota archaeon]|nr:MAG: hypothetical protein E6K91_06730 [Nitrososphaerota archaeon]
MTVQIRMDMGLFGKTKQKDEAVEQIKILLDRFEFTDLLNLCSEVIGRELASTDKKERLERIEVLDFIWENYHKGSVNFSQVKDFAIKRGIVTQAFFD